jgi:hypothetical protein
MTQDIDGHTLVPMKWLFGVVGLSSAVLITVFGIGMWVATISTHQEALGSEVAKIKSESPGISERLARIETILDLEFPDSAKRAKRH